MIGNGCQQGVRGASGSPSPPSSPVEGEEVSRVGASDPSPYPSAGSGRGSGCSPPRRSGQECGRVVGLLLRPRPIGAGGQFGAQYQVCQAAVEFIGSCLGVAVPKAGESEGAARLGHLVGKLQFAPRGHLAQQLDLYLLYIGVRVLG